MSCNFTDTFVRLKKTDVINYPLRVEFLEVVFVIVRVTLVLLTFYNKRI